MEKKTQPVKGMHDILSEDFFKIKYVESLFIETAERYGFLHIKTPILESAEIYQNTSEIPEEKCYSFTDVKGRKMIIRSDPDAQLVRFVANNLMYAPKPIKLAFCGSVFRSQNIHRREFSMFSINTFGISELTADAEIIRVITDVIERVGFPGYRIGFNNLKLFHDIICVEDMKLRGEGEISQILYKIRFADDEKMIAKTLESYQLSRNIINAVSALIKCKDNEQMAYRELAKLGHMFPSLIPEIDKTLSFKTVLVDYGLGNIYLDVSNLHGTGFYSGLTFRIFPKDGSKEIGDGGRYDHMMEQVQGSPLSATGIGLGIERFIDLMEINGCSIKFPDKAKHILVSFSHSQLAISCRPVLKKIRETGKIVEEDLVNRDIDKVLRYARAKKCNQIIMVSTSDSQEYMHIKVINLDNGQAESFEAHLLEELHSILLKC